MLTKRIIPCLDVKGGRVVKGIKFRSHRDAGDPVELADRILQIVKNPSLRLRMSANCRLLVRKYSAEACAAGLLAAALGERDEVGD